MCWINYKKVVFLKVGCHSSRDSGCRKINIVREYSERPCRVPQKLRALL